MIFKKLILFTLTAFTINISCTNYGKQSDLSLSIEKIKIESWLNLMPGGPGSFHLSGEILIKNEENHEVGNLNLSLITVRHDDELLYSFKPVFKTKSENEDCHILMDQEKDFLFYTQSGLPINKKLNTEIPVTILLEFNADDANFTYEVEKVKVEKVY
jgi:hypothetical protein